MHYHLLIVFVSQIIVLCSMIGWGSLIATKSGASVCGITLDIGLISALGIAFTAVIGGGVSLLGFAGETFSQGYLVVGIGFFAVMVISRHPYPSFIEKPRTESPQLTYFVLTICAILAIIRIIPGHTPFNSNDDFHGYLSFVTRLLDSGSIGIDPFSERKMMALGGHSFLQSVMLGLVPLEYVGVFDNGVAWLSFSLLVFGHARTNAVSLALTLVMVSLLQFITVRGPNISAAVDALVLIYAIMRILLDFPRIRPPAATILLSFLIAALCSLKNNFLVPAILIPLFHFLFDSQTCLRKRRKEVIATIGLTIAFLSPWVYQSYISSGTAFYPVLGSGYHGSTYGNFPTSAIANISGFSDVIINISGNFDVISYIFFSPYFLFSLAMLLAICVIMAIDRETILGYIGIFVGAWLSIPIIVFASLLFRYSFPIVICMAIFLLVEFVSIVMARKNKIYEPISTILIFIVLTVFMAIFSFFNTIYSNIKNIPMILDQAMQNDWMAQERREYQLAQSSVPEKEIILVRAAKPFLLNFARNPIYIVDWPGGASLPPGMPLSGDVMQLRSYFLSNNVRYVLYSYSDEAGFSYSDYKNRLSEDGGYKTRVRLLAWHAFRFQFVMAHMGNECSPIFDDGLIFVIDLARCGHTH